MASSKNSINFLGKGVASKSLLNRAWIVKSYFPDFKIIGTSSCDDVKVIKKACQDFQTGKPIYCGESATALRFMTLRMSRQPGEHILTGRQSLFKRPHRPLISILHQLGVKACFLEKKNQIKIKGDGVWRFQGDSLTIPSENSSQFASAFFLNSFHLNQDVFVSLENKLASASYLEMTLSFLNQLGVQIHSHGFEFHIPKNQSVTPCSSYEVEPDMGCLFVIACFAALRGQAVFSPWIQKSFQGDYIFPEILKKMGVRIQKKNHHLKVNQSSSLKPISIDLHSNPDLFPCLAVLCAFAQGKSLFYGLQHVQYKESDRLSLTIKLLQQAGRKIQKKQDGLVIHGESKKGDGQKILFDPQSDHRMCMAAHLLSYLNFDVEIKNPSCVSKSFPEFWNIVGS